MKKQHHWNSKVCGALLVAACAVGLAYVVTCQPLMSRTSVAGIGSGDAQYENADLRFTMNIPATADVETRLNVTAMMPNSVEAAQLKLGRVGGVVFSEEKEAWNIPAAMVSVSAYTTTYLLERDFGQTAERSFEEVMIGEGLTKSTQTIDGASASVYSGVHAVDGVGGSPYEYVAAEVIGPTYSYIIQFTGMGKDASTEQIQAYLTSFDAK